MGHIIHQSNNNHNEIRFLESSTKYNERSRIDSLDRLKTISPDILMLKIKHLL